MIELVVFSKAIPSLERRDEGDQALLGGELIILKFQINLSKKAIN